MKSPGAVGSDEEDVLAESGQVEEDEWRDVLF